MRKGVRPSSLATDWEIAVRERVATRLPTKSHRPPQPEKFNKLVLLAGSVQHRLEMSQTQQPSYFTHPEKTAVPLTCPVRRSVKSSCCLAPDSDPLCGDPHRGAGRYRPPATRGRSACRLFGPILDLPDPRFP